MCLHPNCPPERGRYKCAKVALHLYRPLSSSNFFLCLGGLSRLSGMTRSAGGGPATSRARRRASLATSNLPRILSFVLLPLAIAPRNAALHWKSVHRQVV